MPEITPNLGFPIPPGGDSSTLTRDLRAALLALDGRLRTTGPIELRPQIAGALSGSLTAIRVGNVVTLGMYGLTLDAGYGTGTLCTLPPEYRPHTTTYWGSGGGWLATGQPRININSATGALAAQSLPTGVALYNAISYATTAP